MVECELWLSIETSTKRSFRWTSLSHHGRHRSSLTFFDEVNLTRVMNIIGTKPLMAAIVA